MVYKLEQCGQFEMGKRSKDSDFDIFCVSYDFQSNNFPIHNLYSIINSKT